MDEFWLELTMKDGSVHRFLHSGFRAKTWLAETVTLINSILSFSENP